MVTLILLSHFIYGGIGWAVLKNTTMALQDYYNLIYWLDSGFFHHNDVSTIKTNAIVWSVATLIYIAIYAAIINISLNIL